MAAHSGSKRFPEKNLALPEGKPMIAYAIVSALGHKDIDRVIVSTEDGTNAQSSKDFGVEITDRPAEFDGTPVFFSSEVSSHMSIWALVVNGG